MTTQLNDSREFFVIALSMLEHNKKTNVIPELMQILSPMQIVALVQVYDGKAVKLPTPRELSISLKSALVAYQHYALGKTLKHIKEEEELSDAEYERIMTKIGEWKTHVKETSGLDFLQLIKGQ